MAQSVVTTIINPTSSDRTYSFIPPHGITLGASGTTGPVGDPRAGQQLDRTNINGDLMSILAIYDGGAGGRRQKALTTVLGTGVQFLNSDGSDGTTGPFLSITVMPKVS